jgi:LemA protein
MCRIDEDVSFDPRHIARHQHNRQARRFDPLGAASHRRLADRPVMRYGPGESSLVRRKEPVMSTSTWIILGVIVALVLFVITVYNGLVSLRQRVNQSHADVDVQMKQRHDLIPNLVETVKGYAAHESGTLEAVIKARNSAVAAQGQGPAQQAAAENALTGALRQVFALSEAYPNLKANENFQQLQMELTDLENKIAASRRFFNNAVQEYNTGIQRFPAALFAGALGFSEKQFFDLGADRQAVSEAPQVKF